MDMTQGLERGDKMTLIYNFSTVQRAYYFFLNTIFRFFLLSFLLLLVLRCYNLDLLAGIKYRGKIHCAGKMCWGGEEVFIGTKACCWGKNQHLLCKKNDGIWKKINICVLLDSRVLTCCIKVVSTEWFYNYELEWCKSNIVFYPYLCNCTLSSLIRN